MTHETAPVPTSGHRSTNVRHMRPILSAGLALALASGLFSDVHAAGGGSHSAAPAAKEDRSAAQTGNAARPSPAGVASAEDPERQAITVLVNEERYLEAFDRAAKLNEREPGDARNSVLFARVCYGLGLFDNAIASYFDALKADPSTDMSQLLFLLHSSGLGRQILSEVAEKGEVNINVLAKLEEGLDKIDPVEPAGELAKPAPESGAKPIVVRITDNYMLKVKIGGRTARLLFTTSFGGLSLGDAFASKAGLGSTAGEVKIATVKIGDLSLSDVPARIVPDLDRSTSAKAFDGLIGMGLFPGYAFRVDRKKEELTLFPPGADAPKPAKGATVQRYYQFGPYITSDVVVRNRVSGSSWKTKMFYNTGYSYTMFELGHAQRLGFGQVNSTTTATLATNDSYDKAVEVRMSSVMLGGANFEFERFLASPEGSIAGFRPYGIVGRDVLREFVLTVDTRNHTVALEVYPQ